MRRNKKKVIKSKVFAHGAVLPVTYAPDNYYFDSGWVLFGSTAAVDCDYPVQFRADKLKELIKFLQKIDKNINSRTEKG